MNSLTSHKLTSIAAVAAALVATGSFAHAADGYRFNAHAAPRDSHVERVVVARPAHEVVYAPEHRPVVVGFHTEPRRIERAPARDSWGSRWHDFWCRR